MMNPLNKTKKKDQRNVVLVADNQNRNIEVLKKKNLKLKAKKAKRLRLILNISLLITGKGILTLKSFRLQILMSLCKC
jgi:hypothetical protein